MFVIVWLVHKQQSKHVKVIIKKKKLYNTDDAFDFNEPKTVWIRLFWPQSFTEKRPQRCKHRRSRFQTNATYSSVTHTDFHTTHELSIGIFTNFKWKQEECFFVFRVSSTSSAALSTHDWQSSDTIKSHTGLFQTTVNVRDQQYRPYY